MQNKNDNHKPQNGLIAKIESKCSKVLVFKDQFDSLSKGIAIIRPIIVEIFSKGNISKSKLADEKTSQLLGQLAERLVILHRLVDICVEKPVEVAFMIQEYSQSFRRYFEDILDVLGKFEACEINVSFSVDDKIAQLRSYIPVCTDLLNPLVEALVRTPNHSQNKGAVIEELIRRGANENMAYELVEDFLVYMRKLTLKAEEGELNDMVEEKFWDHLSQIQNASASLSVMRTSHLKCSSSDIGEEGFRFYDKFYPVETGRLMIIDPWERHLARSRLPAPKLLESLVRLVMGCVAIEWMTHKELVLFHKDFSLCNQSNIMLLELLPKGIGYATVHKESGLFGLICNISDPNSSILQDNFEFCIYKSQSTRPLLNRVYVQYPRNVMGLPDVEISIDDLEAEILNRISSAESRRSADAADTELERFDAELGRFRGSNVMESLNNAPEGAPTPILRKFIGISQFSSFILAELFKEFLKVLEALGVCRIAGHLNGETDELPEFSVVYTSLKRTYLPCNEESLCKNMTRSFVELVTLPNIHPFIIDRLENMTLVSNCMLDLDVTAHLESCLSVIPLTKSHSVPSIDSNNLAHIALNVEFFNEEHYMDMLQTNVTGLWGVHYCCCLFAEMQQGLGMNLLESVTINMLDDCQVFKDLSTAVKKLVNTFGGAVDIAICKAIVVGYQGLQRDIYLRKRSGSSPYGFSADSIQKAGDVKRDLAWQLLAKYSCIESIITNHSLLAASFTIAYSRISDASDNVNMKKQLESKRAKAGVVEPNAVINRFSVRVTSSIGAAPFDLQVKHLLIGNSGVGKTCIVNRMALDLYSPTTAKTLGVDFKIKNDLLYGYRVKQQIWDISGQDRFRMLSIQYIKTSMCIYFVFDVGDRSSFLDLRKWLEHIIAQKNDNAILVLVGNKCDIKSRRVSFDEALGLSHEWGMMYFETSASKSINTSFLFQISTYLLLQKRLNDNDEKNLLDICNGNRHSVKRMKQDFKKISTLRSFCNFL